MKVLSWNVNGLQGLLKQDETGENKGTKMTPHNPLQILLEKYDPDILCLQEIKTTKHIDIKPNLPALKHHYIYWNCAQVAHGYSGTLVASRDKPIDVFYNLPADIVEECDRKYGKQTRFPIEGRMITLYFESYTLLNVYSPNAGFGLKRLDERIGWWETALRLFIERLQTGIKKTIDSEETKYKREVIIVGDLNVIPDLKLDRRNLQYQDGATNEERECFNALLSDRKLIDSFRHLYPKKEIYSWVPTKLWDKHFMGCRIDFVLVDEGSIDKVKKMEILTHRGSDHRPVVAVIE